MSSFSSILLTTGTLSKNRIIYDMLPPISDFAKKRLTFIKVIFINQNIYFNKDTYPHKKL